MNTLITVQYNTHQPTAQWVGQEETVMVYFWSWQVDGLITTPSGRPIVWSTCAVVKAIVDVEYYAIMWESTRVKRNVLFRNNGGLKYWTEGSVIHMNKYPMNTETVLLQGESCISSDTQAAYQASCNMGSVSLFQYPTHELLKSQEFSHRRAIQQWFMYVFNISLKAVLELN
jgi:hypothetical protein